MGGGKEYVPVTGDVVNNGIMTMAGSGGGVAEGGIWLHWTASGYTNLGWYEAETPILDWWATYYATVNSNYGTSYAGTSVDELSNWISTNNITDLTAFFSIWSDLDKGRFIYDESHEDVYKACVTTGV